MFILYYFIAFLFRHCFLQLPKATDNAATRTPDSPSPDMDTYEFVSSKRDTEEPFKQEVEELRPVQETHSNPEEKNAVEEKVTEEKIADEEEEYDDEEEDLSEGIVEDGSDGDGQEDLSEVEDGEQQDDVVLGQCSNEEEEDEEEEERPDLRKRRVHGDVKKAE